MAVIAGFPLVGFAIGILAKVAVAAPALAAALIAAVFAWGQWHVARQKLVLDLFEKRYDAYKELRSQIANLMNNPAPRYGIDRPFHRASYEMEYLVGDDVAKHLETMREVALRLAHARIRLEAGRGLGEPNEAAHLVAEMDAHFLELAQELIPLLDPYIRMGQRLPRSPMEACRDGWKMLNAAWKA
ncbi:hypothetical protein [Antarcticirhabdus aurantiaca]|uniref:Uncharacterized protein n=1 Tax=Antarcticirhabdus aurantiaca TaxID=2606717 RepID=A0ACD4NWF0_9HYPH|nr:hypothetical protein [Antarcticirhabdus aurantiaca]WAJ31162.1 hypothetical protein OXU80_13565 [Jeongeuplla avenae]